jgi:hypothetical protein
VQTGRAQTRQRERTDYATATANPERRDCTNRYPMAMTTMMMMMMRKLKVTKGMMMMMM